MSREIVYLDCEAKLWFQELGKELSSESKFCSGRRNVVFEKQKSCPYFPLS